MKKTIGACVLMAGVAMGNTETGKSTLEIQWKNNKGETKTFKVNNIEKEFDPEKIKAKSFLQGNLLPVGFGKRKKFVEKARSVSRSASKECSVDDGKFRAVSRSKSQRSASKSVCSNNGYGSCAERSRSRFSSRSRSKVKGRSCSGRSFKSRSKSKIVRKFKGKRRYDGGDCFLELENKSSGYGRRSDSFGSVCSYGSTKGHGKSYKSHGYGSDYSEGECYGGHGGYGYGHAGHSKGVAGEGKEVTEVEKGVIYEEEEVPVPIIEHKPKYIVNKTYFPKKKQNKHHKARDYDSCRDIDRSSLQKYNRDLDKNLKVVDVNDLAKLLKLEEERKKNISCENKCLSKSKKNSSLSKYSNDKAALAKKLEKEREASCDDIDKLKKAKKNQFNKKRESDKERKHSIEAKNVHNLMNINHKANEELLVNEKDKDNLHSNDKIIEEFDKLEHFKKVCEKCRSASKGRKAKVKKNNDLDKCQNKDFGAKEKEKRGHGKMSCKSDKQNDDFDLLDTDRQSRKSKFLKDNNECDAAKARERSCSENFDKARLSKKYDRKDYDKYGRKDLVKKCKDNNKFVKDATCEDDECFVKKDRDSCSDKTKKCAEEDCWFNDVEEPKCEVEECSPCEPCDG